MPSAIGRSGISDPRTIRAAARGSRVFDLRDYKAVAGQPADTAIAAALAEMGPTAPAVLHIPDSYTITRPIWLTRSHLTITGQSSDVSRLTAAPGCYGHMIVAGINTAVAGGVPTADHFIALDGLGDGSLAGCHGIRLKTDQILAFWSGPFDQPMLLNQPVNRGWRDFRQITLSLILDDRGQPLPVGPLCGLGEIVSHGYQARPWHLLKPEAGWLEFRFATADHPELYRSFYFAEGASVGVKRISIQLDLINCVTQVWVNRVQVATNPRNNLGPASYNNVGALSFTPADNLRLVENDYHPFMIGAYGSNTQSRGGGPVMDLTVYGLALSKGFLYANDGVGQPQRALNGSTVTDSYLVRPTDFTLLARLAIERIAATNPLGGREIPVTIGQACAQGGGVSYGLMSPAEQNLNCAGWLDHYTFRDFALSSPGWYGDLLSLGGAWEVRADHLTFDGGYCNLGSARMGPGTYEVTLADLEFGNSWGAGCFGHSWMATARNFRFLTPLRNSLTLVASNFYLRRAFTNASIGRYTVAAYMEDNGGDYRFEDVTIDNEGNVTPTDASFLIEVPGNQQTSLTIDGVITGSTGPRSALVQLQAMPLNASKHYPVTIKNLKTAQVGCLLRTDCPQVAGEIAADTANDENYPWLELTGGIPTTDLTIRSSRYPVPPGRLVWTDTAVLDVRRPVLGLPARYRGIRAGEYGTATVPAWRPEAVQDDGIGTALGAFSTVSEVITAVVSGVASSGGLYSDWARNTLLNYWLRGVAATAPTVLILMPSITTRNPVDAGASWYGKATATGAFAAAAGRGTTNTAPFTFSLPTIDISDTQSMLLLDGASHVIWQSRLAKALPGYRTDPVLTIAGGGIVVSGGAATGTAVGNQVDETTGGFTNYVLNAETDFWHRGVALPAVAGRYLGLSTGLANREGTVTEPSGNGYARLSLGTTALAVADQGRSMLGTAQAFPAATGANWPTVRGVFLADAASGGNVLWMANLVTPRAAGAGGLPLRFAAGALVVVK
jgi:hypothetical protein